MLSFRPITPADKDLITAFTLKGDRRNCDLAFANLCSWRFLYHTRFAIHDDFLFFKFDAGRQPAYMMPVGEGDFARAVESIVADARACGHTFCMLGLCSYARERLEAGLPGRFQFSAERDYADYIYLRTDLASLQGKKFQAKRNHINRFLNTYADYEYVELRPHHIAECLELEARWFALNNGDQGEDTANERTAMTYALQHFDALGLRGGLLRVNGQTVAFTFGSPINHDTFGIHVEKADVHIDGAYAVINREFAARIPEQYTYLNREEDLGIEGLRKAKLSYHPVMLLEKHIACLADQPMEELQW